MQTAELIDNLAQKMDPVSPAPSPAKLVGKWSRLAIMYIAGAIWVLGIRLDFISKLHSVLFDAELFTLAAITGSCMLASAVLAFPDMYQRKKLVLLPFILFAAFALLMGVSFYADNPPAPVPHHDKECLLSISWMSLFPAAFILYNIRKLASTHSYLTGCICVLGAFSMGAFILRISENTDSVSHLLEWHYLPMLGVAVIGLFIGKLFLKW